MTASGSGSSASSRPPRGDTQREKMEARESTILQAAADVFGERGVDGARMAEIARRAGVAEGTLYLYYRNKQDLLAGVVGHFWAQLTLGARAAVDSGVTAREQLRQLACYHLNALLDQFALVGLTYRARQADSRPEPELNQIREYVRVYDQIIQRGIDRGEFESALPVWQSRDVFFGTLEFSARTLMLRGQRDDSSVIDNLMHLYERYRPSVSIAETAVPVDVVEPRPSREDYQEILARLDRIEEHLTQTGEKAARKADKRKR